MHQQSINIAVLIAAAIHLVLSKGVEEIVMEIKTTFDDFSANNEKDVIEYVINVSKINCVVKCVSIYPECASVLFHVKERYCKLLRIKPTGDIGFYDPMGVGLMYFEYGCWLGWREFHGHCYRLFPNKKKWDDAKLECENYNGYLLEVESANENLWVAENFIKPAELCEKKWHCSVWMGGRLDTNLGVYIWNHTKTPFNFSNWDSYQPSGDYQNCASMWVGGKWDDSGSGAAFEYICEKDLP